MEVSKIHLSSSELELMQNAEIILTKNKILEKMKGLLEEVQEKQIDFVKQDLVNNDIFKVSPKISRGENYLGLPYLILDYPRQSCQNNFVFIRTMFWWGNFFSCTLHIAGNSKKLFSNDIKRSYSELKNHFIGVNNDQWVHHLEDTNFKKISSLTKVEFDQCCDEFEHLKIAGKFSLSEWTNAPLNLFNSWKFYLNICGLIS